MFQASKKDKPVFYTTLSVRVSCIIIGRDRYLSILCLCFFLPYLFVFQASKKDKPVFYTTLSVRVSCIIIVTLQAQREYPADMQCRDKFLLQSTIVPPNTDVDELPADAFNKDSGRAIEECKLKVIYISSTSSLGNSEDEKNSSQSSTALQRLKEDRDIAIRQTHQLQQELDMMKRRKYRKGDPGFSFTFAIFVGIVGIIAGFLLNLTLSSPSTE
ncbi:vesicle-associated protein 2-1-like isoform X2 [Cucurbita pepo subsp. pepo]|uniref:vesicle-associated protein 2-1-like isoform X2 n=1 Tax=Cucurbita pepo subsp. pepo TaxID=3664 RepID=UPI000C9D950E|nr:vesicle-associated protein 2-1-like isoform X2 [Cucurbita pepo subsp. pepo]